MSSSCDPSACLLRSGAGEWHSGQWQWASEARCCGFGEVGRERARALLRGRSLTFVGDSTARRWLWALVDSVGGMRRRRGHAVPDSSAAFDFKAIALNDSMFDTARAYHAGQAVLLNVRTGRWVMLDPEQLCGVPRSEWTVDRRFVHAVEMGRPPPWSTMRGVRYRLLVEVALRRGADARRSQLSAGELRRLEAQVALRSMRRLVEAALPRVECASLPCTYQEWMDQQCSKALVRPAATSPSAGQPAGGAGAERATRLTISMGTTSGYCGALMHRMAAKLRDWTSDGDDRPPSSSAPPATVAQAAGRLRILTAVPDPICDSYCRRSYRMVCPGGYERAIASALRKHRAALQLPAEEDPPSGPGQGVAGHLSGDLTLLSFVYAADLDSEWRGLPQLAWPAQTRRTRRTAEGSPPLLGARR
mmetsp:Transcript_45313/g.146000  ORF Transcript_45313/g.146000 Transcript_45313/m.146000 type:complete len:419 (-) Transcript_45313:625-1881(-)